jgi:hypothetical protein
MEMERWSDRDRKIGRQKDRETIRLRDRKIKRQKDREKREIEGQIDRDTER